MAVWISHPQTEAGQIILWRANVVMNGKHCHLVIKVILRRLSQHKVHSLALWELLATFPQQFTSADGVCSVVMEMAKSEPSESTNEPTPVYDKQYVLMSTMICK